MCIGSDRYHEGWGSDIKFKVCSDRGSLLTFWMAGCSHTAGSLVSGWCCARALRSNYVCRFCFRKCTSQSFIAWLSYPVPRLELFAMPHCLKVPTSPLMLRVASNLWFPVFQLGPTWHHGWIVLLPFINIRTKSRRFDIYHSSLFCVILCARQLYQPRRHWTASTISLSTRSHLWRSFTKCM